MSDVPILTERELERWQHVCAGCNNDPVLVSSNEREVVSVARLLATIQHHKALREAAEAKIEALEQHAKTVRNERDYVMDVDLKHETERADAAEQALTQAEAKVAGLVEALRRADAFMTNGIALGYIRMPDDDVPDPAKETPNIVRAALANLPAASVALAERLKKMESQLEEYEGAHDLCIALLGHNSEGGWGEAIERVKVLEANQRTPGTVEKCGVRECDKGRSRWGECKEACCPVDRTAQADKGREGER